MSDVVTNLLPSGLKSTSITWPSALEYSETELPDRMSQSFTEPFEPPVINKLCSEGWNLTTFTTWFSEKTCANFAETGMRITCNENNEHH